MNKVEVGTLDENELFEHRGVIQTVQHSSQPPIIRDYIT
jgi:hypothetical protein